MKDRYLELDILKTIAFVMVFLVHYSQMFPQMNYYAHSLLKYGQTGCQLFLVVSGYLMAHSFEQGRMSAWGQYFRKRYISLFSGFTIAIVFYCLLSFVLTLCAIDAPFVSDKRIISILINFLMLHGVVPFCNNTVVPGGWYVGTVVIAYAIIPPILRKVKGYEKLFLLASIVTLIALMIAVLFASYHLSIGNNTFFYYSIICQISPILIGCAVYYRKKEHILIGKSIILLGAFSIVTLLIFITDIDWLATLIPFTVSLSFIGLFDIVKNCVSKTKSVRILVAITGQNSFGCYLFHFIFAWFIPYYAKRFLGLSDSILFALLIIPCFVLAAFSGIIINKFISKETQFFLRISGKTKAIG